MQVADELCHRLAFIVDGEIKLIDSPRNLKLKYGERVVEVEYRDDDKTLKRERFSLSDPEEQARLNARLASGNIETMHTKEATLEEIFITVTGRGLS
jgi:fluoroquinolone transport system ATP-binding protein